MNKYLFLLVFIVSGYVNLYAQTEFTHPDILSFEDNKPLFEASKHSELTISPMHYKHGKQSLQWTWNGDDASISLSSNIEWEPDPTDALDPSTRTFVFWLYNTHAEKGATFRFEFLKEGKVCSWLDYGLDFTGWRGAWVAFERDMQGAPVADMDELRITAQGVSNGTVFFDLIILSSLQDIRQHSADTQAPFINKNTTGHWLVNEQCSHYTFDLPIAVITDHSKKEMAKVEQKYSDFYLDGVKPKKLNKLKEQLGRIHIEENTDGTLFGKPIFFSRWAETYYSLGHPRNTKVFRETVVDLEDANRLLLDMAVLYRLSPNSAERAEVKAMYLLLTRYMIDQGFVYGASLGTIHHMGYSMRDFYPAFFLMKDKLYAANLGEDIQRAMEWFSNAAEVKRKPGSTGMDIDIFNTTLMGRLGAILMLKDTDEKLTYMNAYKRWLDNGFTPSLGLGPTFKIDGSVFHHRNNYPAYARDGMRGAVEGVYVLAQTDFAVSEAGHRHLKETMLTMRFYCNLRTWPLSMSGRHPKGGESLSAAQFGLLSLAGSPDGKLQIDTDIAAAYLRLVENKPSVYTTIFETRGIVAEPSPVGNKAMPYASSLTHRRNDWSATVRGHSRYLWAAETYERANLYGRYLAHGNLQIISNGDPVSNNGSGYEQQGWDWNHWWGTTATVLPMHKLKANVLNVDQFSGNEEMLYSDETFAGPVSIGNANGAYGMKLHEHDKYNGSLRARKSYFFFDNRIICLGTDIESEIADTPTETTLFQEYISADKNAIVVNGEEVNNFPYHWQKDGNNWIIDTQNNAYFVKDGNTYIRRSRQHSFDQSSAQPTENDFTVAAISHGNAPIHGRYEYAVLVQPTEKELKVWSNDFAKKANPFYSVLRQDKQAHIVYDRASKTTGYVLFEVGELATDGIVLSNSLPCLIMLAEKDAKSMTVSLADPDLRLYEGEADEIYDAHGKRIERSIYSRPWIDNESGVSRPRIAIAGQWALSSPAEYCQVVSSDSKQTILEFSCQHGLSREVELIKVK